MRQLEFLAQINFFSFWNFILCFGFLFLWKPLSSVLQKVHCQLWDCKAFWFRCSKLQLSFEKPIFSAFTVKYTILHSCSCAPKGLPYINWRFFPLLYFSAVNNLVHSGVLHNQEHDESSLASDCWLNWHELTSWKMWVRKCFKKTQSEPPQPFIFTLCVTTGVIFAVGQRPNSMYRSDAQLFFSP